MARLKATGLSRHLIELVPMPPCWVGVALAPVSWPLLNGSTTQSVAFCGLTGFPASRGTRPIA
jgi:hypothetical protein